jgi:flagellar biosynthesis protein FliQ
LQENVLSFVPKLGAALLVIALAGHWMLDEIAQFTKQSISAHSERRPHP